MKEGRESGGKKERERKEQKKERAGERESGR